MLKLKWRDILGRTIGYLSVFDILSSLFIVCDLLTTGTATKSAYADALFGLVSKLVLWHRNLVIFWVYLTIDFLLKTLIF